MAVTEGSQIGDRGPSSPDSQEQLQLLWIKYLGFLDQYSKAQQEIARHFSSGIFALAEANFKNTTRTRYGQDYYDGRMHAATRYAVAESTVKSTSATQAVTLTATSLPHKQPENAEADGQVGGVVGIIGSTADETQDQAERSPGDVGTATDPIKWFGILVPPQLRSCQESFLNLATGPLIDAVNASRSLRQVEIDIRRLHKDMRKTERAGALPK